MQATSFDNRPARRRRLHTAALALALSLAGIGFTAHAGIAAFAPSAAPAPAIDTPAPAAPAPAYAAIAPGMTGTAALPDEPADYAPTTDPTLVAAPPFAFRGSALDRARALECLTTAIYYEAASEPDAGQAAVAQVILNRVRHPTFPNTVCGVIYQGSERSGCQFSYACDGSLARKPSANAWTRARRAAERALSGAVFAPVGMATHYHTYAVTPYWNKSLVMTGVFGAHFFHRWKGYWGTPAAFTDIYRGGEPAPVPLSPPPTIAAATPQPGPSTTPAIEPTLAQTGTPTPPPVEDSLPQSPVLDKWKDSGKPLI